VERKWQESVTRSNFGDDAPAPATRRSTGGYAQLLLAPVGDATVALGGRFEHNEQFGDFWTYRAAASTRLPQGTRLRASIGTAFREPTFLETEGSGFVIGNRGLDPEHALSVDAGVEQTVGHATIGATWFANSFRDMIDYKYSATEPNYFNVARTRAAGLELEGRLDLPNGFHADAAFTHLSTRVVDPGTSTAATATFAPGLATAGAGPRAPSTPGAGYRARGNAVEVARTPRRGRARTSTIPPDFAPAQRVSLAPYTRVDLLRRGAPRAAQPARGRRADAARREPVRSPLHRCCGITTTTSRAPTRRRSSRPATGCARRLLTGLRVSY
jgi:outer membrane receptor protein involved in Fe transport